MYSINKKVITVISVLFIIIFSGFSYSQTKEIVEVTGTIKYFSFEGGFYGIVGDDGKSYDPIKLDKDYCSDNLRVKVLGFARNDIMSTHNWGTIVEINNIEIIQNSFSNADYEIHEWGVMIGCPKDNNYFNTSRPEMQTLVKQPVVYVHANNKVPFDLKVTFNTGKPTSVYPSTNIDNNITEWKNVQFEETKEINKSFNIKSNFDTNNLRPLKEIINTLNDVDADRLFYNNTSTNFLFYEGEMNFENKIETNYDAAKGEVTIKNNFSFEVNNVVFSTATGNFINTNYLYGKAEEIQPNESIVIKLTNPVQSNWTNDLKSLGFTDREAVSFSRLWERPFLEKTNQSNWSNLIYRIPQEELEKMITLEFNPAPKKIVRTLYILVGM
jgi:hypothetical protein